jgi:hypothetical protein
VLNYVIPNPRGRITLNLFEAERYEPAVIVQSLIGNLVYHTNHGHYEPRLARSWTRTAPDTWTFELRENLSAENGEPITPRSFKQSLERVLRILGGSGPFPVLSNLIGYAEFIAGANNLAGILANEKSITFCFRKPVRDGLVQVLSFAPFGYIAAENFNPDGTWKDDFHFISSGPYRFANIASETEFLLDRQRHWTLPFAPTAPERIRFLSSMPKTMDLSQAWIVDAFTSEFSPPEWLQKFSLTPEYLNAILLGNLSTGYFADLRIRQGFKSLVNKFIRHLPESWGAHIRCESFYPRPQQALPDVRFNFPMPTQPLLIEGEDPKKTDPRSIVWSVLKSALQEANLPYQFKGNVANMKDFSNTNFDIRIRGSATGNKPEAWGLKIIFGSELGIRLPDPRGRVLQLIQAFEDGQISDPDFTNKFIAAVEEDAAILPVSRSGGQLFLSSQISRESLSPNLNIIRFDQLSIDSQNF